MSEVEGSYEAEVAYRRQVQTNRGGNRMQDDWEKAMAERDARRPKTFLVDRLTKRVFTNEEEFSLRRAIERSSLTDAHSGKVWTIQDVEAFTRAVADNRKSANPDRPKLEPGKRPFEGCCATDFAHYLAIAGKVSSTLRSKAQQEPIGSASYSWLAVLAGISEAVRDGIEETIAQDEISRGE
jgi:hypothetical protein